ncbi:hypothetical protein GCM10022281_04790 [Sphingomonas rosea]|jgi:membrane protein YdbS with pleckstrin-like domain|uniref:YdbS-like PH domain-containing protein n=1 Tax=Sphingomonas rosea TaxID=335605 RepID=A0ABP7TN47_9SPHN
MTAGDGIEPVERGYLGVLRVQRALAAVPLVVGAFVLWLVLFERHPLAVVVPVVAMLLAVVMVGVLPGRSWRRLGFALEPRLLRVVRGYLFHTDTIVPLARVQHLDVARGPLDRLFGTATLVVHTAGTHNSVVTLPGLSPERAGELAGVIRGHIQADPDAS